MSLDFFESWSHFFKAMTSWKGDLHLTQERTNELNTSILTKYVENLVHQRTFISADYLQIAVVKSAAFAKSWQHRVQMNKILHTFLVKYRGMWWK